jgi:hypothetical protein
MGKKVEIDEHSESEQSEAEEAEESVEEARPTEEQVNAKFAYKGINEKELLLERLVEVEKNFYNRMESARLIKKQGHIPFTEHMSISKSTPYHD